MCRSRRISGIYRQVRARDHGLGSWVGIEKGPITFLGVVESSRPFLIFLDSIIVLCLAGSLLYV